MRQFIVYDKIAEEMKRFYSVQEAKQEAMKKMRVYIKLNRRVRCNQKNSNFYIYLKTDEGE